MSRLESNQTIKNNHLNKKIGKRNYFNVNFNNNITFTFEELIAEREQIYKSLQSLSSVLDSSGEYRILSFLSTGYYFKHSQWKYSIVGKLDTLDGSNLYQRNDISIVSHCTVYQLYHLDLLSKKWNGSISLSIFAHSIQQIPIVVEVILLLRYCNPSIYQKTSFHLVYPLNFSSKLNNHQVRSALDFLKWPDIKSSYPEFSNFISADHCNNIKKTIEQIFKTNVNNYDHDVPYPNNLLRNIARRYALTEYTFVIDIDLVPSANLYEKFIQFAEKTKLFKETEFYLDNNDNEDKVVFVVPAFEIDFNMAIAAHENTFDENSLLPNDKEALIDGIEKRYIRPFYIELCWKCQKYTDYESWLHASKLNNNSSPDLIDILFEVSWHDPWEPFYISRNKVPFYDERFRQYGFNRISQVD